MFSGIIEHSGWIRNISPMEGGLGLNMTIEVPGPLFHELQVNDSLAVNGVCQTIVKKNTTSLSHFEVEVQVVPTTLQKTTLGNLKSNQLVNLERALKMSDVLGGHLVSGHVQGVALCGGVREEGQSKRLQFIPPPSLSKYLVQEGSVAIDGISLTLAAVTRDDFEVAIIPHTLQKTTLKSISPGAKVNLEVDLLAKNMCDLLERLLPHYVK